MASLQQPLLPQQQQQQQQQGQQEQEQQEQCERSLPSSSSDAYFAAYDERLGFSEDDRAPLLVSVVKLEGALIDIEDDIGGHSTFLPCTFNLAKVIMGAGMMAVPKAFYLLGIPAGTAILVCIAFLSYFTLAGLVEATQKTGARSYASLARTAVGAHGELALTLAIFLNCFVMNVVFLVVIGDMLVGTPTLCNGLMCELTGMSTGPLNDRRIVLGALSLLVLGPLASQRTMEALAMVNVAGVLANGLFALSTIALAAAALSKGVAHRLPLVPQWDLLSGDTGGAADAAGVDLAAGLAAAAAAAGGVGSAAGAAGLAVGGMSAVVGPATQAAGGMGRLLRAAAAGMAGSGAMTEAVGAFPKAAAEAGAAGAAAAGSGILVALSLAAVVPILLNCDVCHQSLHPLMPLLRPYSHARMKKVVACALGVCNVLYLAIALGCCLAFGPELHADVLQNISPGAMAPLVGQGVALGIAYTLRVGYLLSLVGSYVLLCYPLRECITSIALRASPSSLNSTTTDASNRPPVLPSTNAPTSGSRPSSTLPPSSSTPRGVNRAASAAASPAPAMTHWALMTWALVGGAYGVAAFVGSIWGLLALVGATASTVQAFIVPGLIILNTVPRTAKPRTLIKRALAALVLVLGALLFVNGAVHELVLRLVASPGAADDQSGPGAAGGSSNSPMLSALLGGLWAAVARLGH